MCNPPTAQRVPPRPDQNPTEPQPPRQKRSLSPRNHRIFDPWNSASSGHQRADSGYLGTTRWRDTRIAKLKQQFRGEDCSREQLGVLGDDDFKLDAFGGGSCDDREAVSGLESGSRENGVLGLAAPSGKGKWEWISDEEAKRMEWGVRDIRCFMGVGKRKPSDALQGKVLNEKKKRRRRRIDEGDIQRSELRPVEEMATTIQKEKPKNQPEEDTNKDTKKQKSKKPRMFDEVDNMSVDSSATRISDSTSSSNSSSPTLIPATNTTTPNPPPESQPDPESRSMPKLPTRSSKPPTSASVSIPIHNTIDSRLTKIFTGTTIYINGSTLPQISDHKLKSLLAENGATVAIAMARRSVSHVIIGQPGTTGHGCGGGLAARKLQREIERGGWKGVRIVGVDCAPNQHLTTRDIFFVAEIPNAQSISHHRVLESIKAGKRLAESRFAVMSVASKGQRSVASLFGR
ncbi:hypothetical protein N7539_005366 [Penicillium diatomitis]|uniref:BRCT domain-containing protein n=1 Tax=Penicillium diatomitis TaxID=2819901 RepID=A0A9W9X6S8_9EURO|nr:uncharacterized protein N7539_005366 [Penicillium diatomitis]KAJ5485378.1 hypothetical protein N7539_005366 [Penicillium diatomitis]